MTPPPPTPGTPDDPGAPDDPRAPDEGPGLPVLGLRGVLGGLLMGLANLVPGISGGTMLVAAGIYPRFIAAVAEVTTLRFRAASVVTLASVALAAAAGIVLLAGPVKDLVVTRQWIMYSLFIGLTLGGVPLVWRMARPPTTAVWVGTAAGIAVMAVLAFVEPGGGGAGERDLLLLFLAGVAGASAMVLPGVSGGYLLLVMGQYVPILSAIERARLAVPAGRWDAAAAELATFVPVGLGVVVGIVGVSNLVKLLLERVPKPTLGVLLGLLLGAVLGLYPFQAPVAPSPGDTLQGSRVTAVEVRPDAEGTQRRVAVTEAGEVEVEDWPRERFTPSAAQLVSALLLVVAGFGATAAISRIGGRPSTEEATRPVSG